MRHPSRVPAVLLLLLAFGLSGWVLFDATEVRRALGLEALLSEATVALLGLLVATLAAAAASALWRRGGRNQLADGV